MGIRLYSNLILQTEWGFRAILGGLILAALVAWALLAGWPVAFTGADNPQVEGAATTATDAGPDFACRAEAEQQRATCRDNVTNFINMKSPASETAAVRRLCAIGRGGVDGLRYPSREAKLVGDGTIGCELGEWLATRGLLYRYGLASARASFWIGNLTGLLLLALALVFAWRTYATRRALYWLYASEHP